MTIVRCPRCRDEVTMPAKATSRALVRCPLCLEQYLLAEALGNAPPPLVIIGGEVEQAAIEAADADGIEYEVADALVGRGPAAGSLRPARPMVRPLARPRKKEKNGLVLLVNYVLGGVLGLSLGLLLLWWGFGRDPLELGPKTAEYAPWIVPARFHGKGAGNDGGVTTVRTPEVAVGGVSVVPSKKSAMAKEQVVEPPSEIGGGEAVVESAPEPVPDLRDLLPDGAAS